MCGGTCDPYPSIGQVHINRTVANEKYQEYLPWTPALATSNCSVDEHNGCELDKDILGIETINEEGHSLCP